VAASAQAGVLAGHSYASSPALGAPLVGSVTHKAPEVTVVKQSVVVDQPEIRYRAVPTVVHTAPVVKTVAPGYTFSAAPAIVKTVAPAPAVVNTLTPAYTYAASAPYYGYGYAAAPAYSYYNNIPAATYLTYKK